MDTLCSWTYVMTVAIVWHKILYENVLNLFSAEAHLLNGEIPYLCMDHISILYFLFGGIWKPYSCAAPEQIWPISWGNVFVNVSTKIVGNSVSEILWGQKLWNSTLHRCTTLTRGFPCFPLTVSTIFQFLWMAISYTIHVYWPIVGISKASWQNVQVAPQMLWSLHRADMCKLSHYQKILGWIPVLLFLSNRFSLVSLKYIMLHKERHNAA